ncbi:MAG: glutathione S-transferase N-terminal domain-containing protein [Pseudomonadota bacterium]
MLLVGESFSPWTKKARWALEYCGLVYKYQEYTPTLSEPGLRWRMRQFSGEVSVPVLFAGREVLRGSWDIACYANAATANERLGNMEAIDSWNRLSEAALAEGRTRVIRAVLGNEIALEEALPGFIPHSLRKPLRFLAKDAAKRLDRKYAHLLKLGSVRSALAATREGLGQSGNDFLNGNFSYADITMAVVLEVIAPIACTDPPLGPEMQRCWNDSELAEEFTDLIQWRNRLASDRAISYSQFNSLETR